MAKEFCATTLEDDVRVFGLGEKGLEVKQTVLPHLLHLFPPCSLYQVGQLARDGDCDHHFKQASAPCGEKPLLSVMECLTVMIFDGILWPELEVIRGNKFRFG